MIELEHSPLGGSGAHRFMTCLGSFLLHRKLLEAGEFENIESEYALLGTAAHEVGALCLTQDKEPYEFIGWKCGPYTVARPSDKSEPNTIDPDALAIYVNECYRLRDMDKGGSELIETTIKLPEIHPLLKGTIDYGRWSPKIGMHLRDYKNGEGVGVRAVNNKQLKYYGFLQAMINPWLREAAPKDFRVSLGIVQPNFYGIYEEPDVWETTLGPLLEWGHDELVPYMHKATGRRTDDIDDGDFVPGDHCQFCPVMLECPRAQAAFKKIVGGAEHIITLADGEDTIAMLSNEELDEYFGEVRLATKFTNVLKTTVQARLMTGAEMQNARLVEKKTNRVWKAGAQQALHNAFGADAYTPKKIKSPAQIEKLSSRGKELALEFGYKPDANGYSVAGHDDPRPTAAFQSTNEKAFAGFKLTPPDLDL